MDAFFSALNAFNRDGVANWNGCTLANKIPNLDTSQTGLDLFERVYTNISGKNNCKVKAFMFVKNDRITNNCGNDNGLSEENYYGNPLIYDNNSSSEDVILDNSKTVGQTVLEPQHLVEFQMGQRFFSYFAISFKKNIEQCQALLPLFIFCDGHKNNNNIYGLLVHCQYDTAVKIATENFLIVETITCKGPFQSQMWEKKKVEFLTNPILYQPHMLGARGELPESSSSVFQSFSHFQLFGASSSILKSLEMGLDMSSITADVTCKKVRDVFELLPQHISSVNVNICPVPGDIRSPAYSLYKDVQVLEGLLSVFGPSQEVKWAPEEAFDELEKKQKKDIIARVREVIAVFNGYKTSQMLEQKLDDQEKNSEEDEDILFNVIVPREELDFTECMWDVLKTSQSLQELKNGLSIIIDEIVNGRASHFWLHETSDSIMADLIKQSYEGKAKAPSLNGTLPIQVLVEIGLDKLSHDYFNFFDTHRLSTAAKLAKFFPVSSSKDTDADKMRRKFLGIQKLHHVVELTANCRVFLQLPLNKISKLIRSTLQTYLDEDVDFSKVFSLAVSYSEITAYLSNLQPVTWRVTASGSNEYGKNTCSAFWSRDFPLSDLISPPLLDSSMTETDPEEVEEKLEYYFSTLSESVHPIY
ncbi:unnamed protein product [Clavelina lepadiformis]|uniref:Protein zwilch n=1 Tax=Clavelina lepadiformis TaxID=159417 RepID=A0ABP0G9P6_CLALP